MEFFRQIIAWILAFFVAIGAFFGSLFQKIRGGDDITTTSAVTDTTVPPSSVTEPTAPSQSSTDTPGTSDVTDPSDSTGPSGSTGPSDSTGSSDATDSSDTTDPSGSTGPSDSTDPTGTSDTTSSSDFSSENTTAEPKIQVNDKGSFGGPKIDKVVGADARGGTGYVACTIESISGDYKGKLPSGSSAPFGALRKYNGEGTFQKEIIIGKSGTSTYLSDVCALKNGNAVVCGYHYDEKDTSISTTAFLAEYDSNLTLVWKKEFTGTGTTFVNCVSATSDGFVAGGRTSCTDGDFDGVENHGAYTAFFIRYKVAVGDNGKRSPSVLWKRYLAGESEANVRAISADLSNNIFVSISTASVTGNFAGITGLVDNSIDSVVLKYDYAGDLQWTYTASSAGRDYIDALVPDTNGGCVAGFSVYPGSAAIYDSFGGTLSFMKFAGNTDCAVLKLSTSGELSWYKNLSGVGDDYITDVARVTGAYIIGGYSSSVNRDHETNFGMIDGFAEILSLSGKKIDERNYGGSENDRVTAIAVTNSNLLVCGNAMSQDCFFEGMNQYATSLSGGDVPDCFVIGNTLNLS